MKLIPTPPAFDLIQNVKEGTHIKGHTMDFILNRSCDKLTLNNVRVCDLISDHYLVCCELSLDKPAAEKGTIVYRNLTIMHRLSEGQQALENVNHG